MPLRNAMLKSLIIDCVRLTLYTDSIDVAKSTNLLEPVTKPFRGSLACSHCRHVSCFFRLLLVVEIRCQNIKSSSDSYKDDAFKMSYQMEKSELPLNVWVISTWPSLGEVLLSFGLFLGL